MAAEQSNKTSDSVDFQFSDTPQSSHIQNLPLTSHPRRPDWFDNPSPEQIASVEPYAFVSVDSSRPLCHACASLRFADLISTDGVIHQPSGEHLQRQFRDPSGCPLCSFIWESLCSGVDARYDAAMLGTLYLPPLPYFLDSGLEYIADEYETREERLEALALEPLMLFLNPLLLTMDPLSMLPPLSNNIEPYRITNLSAWSSDREDLENIYLCQDVDTREPSYCKPLLFSKPSTSRSRKRSTRREELKLKRIVESVDLTVLTSWNDPLVDAVSQKSVISDMKSPEAICMVKRWIGDCTSLQASCRTSDKVEWLPTRLIDVGNGSTQAARLVVTAKKENVHDLYGGDKRYVALSYCWGPNSSISTIAESESSATLANEAPDFATTPATLELHERSLQTHLLPKTILDAIELVRLLGIRYLWADSICIIQGSSKKARADWGRESTMMADVYGNAWLTIAAAWASSMHEGIFIDRPSKVRSREMIGIRSLTHTERMGTVELVPNYKPPGDVSREPLSHRGWALQERVLSRRVLICGRDQFVYEDANKTLTESGCRVETTKLRPGSLYIDRILGLGARHYFTQWQTIVEDYTRRLVTQSSDKLPAIGGLAKRYQELGDNAAPAFEDFPADLRYEYVYLAGLWKFSLGSDLFWVHRNWNSSPVQTYRAPSWSWASVEGAVGWFLGALNYSDLGLINFAMTPRTSDIFGEIQSAHLTFKAELWKIPDHLKRVILEARVNQARQGYNKVDDEGHSRFISGMRLDYSREETWDSVKFGNSDLYLMTFRSRHSLVLAFDKIDHSRSIDKCIPCFTRVGVHGYTGSDQRHHSWQELLLPVYETTVCTLI